MRKKFLLMTFLLAIIGFCGTNLRAQGDLQIATEEELRDFANAVNSGVSYAGQSVTLTDNITLSSEWTPIGNGARSSKTYTGYSFKGTFDGGDYTISGLTITSTTADDAAVGLFGVVDGGTVKNLNLTDVNINVASSDLAGAAIGMMLNGATADKITVSGAIVGYDGVGGIVGRLIIDGTISNCTNNASVTSSYGGIGGIVGKPYYEDGANTSTFASITNCINNGTVTAPMYVGGIAGLARANVTNCTNNGAVVGGTQTGGIVGQLIAAGTVSGNENKAKVSGKNHLGGIIGDYTQSSAYTYYNVSIANNINRGELAATEQCAAIMGCNNIDGFTEMTATGNVSYYYVEGLELFGNPEDMVIDATNKFIVPVAKIDDVEYMTFAEAAAAAQAGDEIKLLADIDGDITVPANVTLNGNGFAISGGIFAEGDITFAGVTTAADFDANVVNTAVNIPAGASLQLTGSARLVIGHGATFNITGTIEDAKTADKATLVPSLKIAAGASITGNGVTFNVNNAYIVANANTTSKNSNANGTLDFNINNSIWEQTGVLAFYVPTSGKDPVVNFELKNSVLTTTSHLVFSVTKGEIVIDNSLVNQGTSRQIENRSTMTIKNSSVVNGAVATSSNAKNPGTIIVEDATYAVTGEFSGSDLGTGTLIVKKGATVSAGSITKANIQIDATDMTIYDEINLTANLANHAGTLEVINNDNLDAEIKDGKIVLVEKPVAQIGTVKYGTLQAAINAVQNGETITLLSDITENVTLTEKVGLYYTINGSDKTMNGKITVNSLSDTNDNRRITISNIKFVDNTDTDVDFISAVNTNHYPRLTVEGCTFTGSGNNGDVAVRLKSSHSVVIENCTGTGLHSFLQNTSGWNLTINNVTVTESKGGLALGTVQGVTVKDSNIDVNGYGIRLDAQYNNNAVIESNAVKAFIPVVVRKAEVVSSITFSGTNTMTASNTDGLWCAIGTSEYEENGTMPTAPTGDVTVTLNDTGLSMDGVYGEYFALNGEGTAGSPYLINNVYELKGFRDQVNAGNNYQGKYVKLTGDIDLNNEEWTPIGNNTNQFQGYFDGNNKTISNLKVTGNTRYKGFFGYIKGTGMSATTAPSVKDLTLDGVNVNVEGDGYYVGGLAGQAYTCNITNVTVKGNVSGVRYVGGLVGHVYTYFKDCHFIGNASCSFDALGGIAGAGDCRAYDCSVIGDVTGSNWVGGIVGNGQEGTSAVGCYVKGDVKTSNNYYRGVGGIAGVAGHGYASSEFKNNYFDGEVYLAAVKVPAMIMGLVNANDNASIKATVEGNSWNTDYYDVNTPVYVVAEISSSDASLEDWIAGASEELTKPRNNNLIMLESDLQYVTEEDYVIMSFSEVTEEQVEQALINNAVAKIGETTYTTLQKALDAAVAGTGNVTVEIIKDVVAGV